MDENIEIIRPDIKDKKKKKSFKRWEKILIFVSILFIIGCFIFYGYRLIKYYKVYNPKIDGETKELVMNSIVRNSTIVYENDGLYRISGMYVYKGINVNNYIRYSNMLFRIIKFNPDGSLDLVLDDSINMLKWDNEVKSFIESDIYKYLNNYFYKLIDDTYLTTTSICSDIVSDLNKITCNNKNTESYVRLLNVSEYLNSKAESSYINGGNIWLSSIKEDKIWNVSGDNLSLSDADNMYYIKPVITIKNSAILLGGKGTKEEPYYINENNELTVGSYVKLNNDIWTIYDKENDLFKLSLNDTLEDRNYSIKSVDFDIEDENSLAYYLNNTYYSSLSYKDIIVENNYYNGNYEGYIDTLSSTIKAKVGLLNVSDLKLANFEEYYLLTPSTKDKMYLYSSTVKDCNPNLHKKIIPTISISKLNIVSGKGTSIDPYILEV